MNVSRRCRRPGCSHYAVATLTFVYADSTAVIGPLNSTADPHAWDLCIHHAGKITAPKGWNLVRKPGPFVSATDDSDLIALAEAVRENKPDSNRAYGRTRPLEPWSHQPNIPAMASSHGLPRTTSGRQRGHLRVLPDLQD